MHDERINKNILYCLYFFTGSTNLVGKFTQSVRRIVQDVKDEGSPSKFHDLLLLRCRKEMSKNIHTLMSVIKIKIYV